jgi:hypothetical protein
MNKDLLPKNINTVIASYLMVLYALWGTGWDLIFGVSIPGLWYLSIIFLVLFQFKYHKFFYSGTGLIITFVTVILIFYSVMGLHDILTNQVNSKDLNYLSMYNLKFFVSIFSILVFLRLYANFDDFEIPMMFLSLTFFALCIFLHWKYYVFFNREYLGVVINETGPLRSGKNSLAIATAVISPFLVAYLLSTKKIMHRVFGFLGVMSILVFMMNLQSRSMVVTIAIVFTVFTLFTHNKKVKLSFLLIGFVASSLLIMDNFNYKSYLYKTGTFEEEPKVETINPYSHYDSTKGGPINKYLNSHRGWLLQEAINGFIDSNLMGNGVATFRIRESNLGSRTETHNDYALVLYEQGVVGFLVLIFLILYRLKRTYKANQTFTKNYYITASLSSLVGLSASLFFINLYQTQIFWVIIGFNYLLVEKLLLSE